MRYEISRQLIHLSGLVFVLLAQFTEKFMASFLFFVIALAFFFCSEYVRKGNGLSGGLEHGFKSVVLKLDRGVKKPLAGAFWFYLALGLTFLLFPLEIAIASGLILSVGDSLSTLVGLRYGKHKILGRKSLEGSIAFFLSSFLITAALLGSLVAFLGSISATFVELIPEAEKIRNWERRERVDDNWLIPLFSGLVMHATRVLTRIA